jgi:cyclic pyranopterin phosphate synthase
VRGRVDAQVLALGEQLASERVNLRDPLRLGEPMEPLFRRALAEKPKEHQLLQMQVGGLRALSQVGG